MGTFRVFKLFPPSLEDHLDRKSFKDEEITKTWHMCGKIGFSYNGLYDHLCNLITLSCDDWHSGAILEDAPHALSGCVSFLPRRFAKLYMYTTSFYNLKWGSFYSEILPSVFWNCTVSEILCGMFFLNLESFYFPTYSSAYYTRTLDPIKHFFSISKYSWGWLSLKWKLSMTSWIVMRWARLDVTLWKRKLTTQRQLLRG